MYDYSLDNLRLITDMKKNIKKNSASQCNLKILIKKHPLTILLIVALINSSLSWKSIISVDILHKNNLIIIEVKVSENL